MHLPWARQWRGGDGVEARLQWLEALQERFGVGAYGGEFFERSQDIEAGRVAVGVLARCQRLGLAAALAADEHADQAEQRVGRRPQRVVLDQGLTDGLVADRKFRGYAEAQAHRLGQLWIVAGEEAEAVARRIGKAAASDVEHDVARVLLGIGTVEPRP